MYGWNGGNSVSVRDRVKKVASGVQVFFIELLIHETDKKKFFT